MNKTLFFFAILLGILLYACASKHEQDIARDIASKFKAKSYKLGQGVSASTNEGSHKSIQLSLEGMDAVNLNEKIASLAAYYFYENDTLPDSKYNSIEITLSDGSSTFEKTYCNDSIAMIPRYLKGPITSFFKYYLSDSIRCAVDTSIPDSTLKYITKGIHSVDSVYGPIQSMNLKGFAFMHIITTNEPVIVLWVDAETDKYITAYQFLVSPKTSKIIEIQVNPK